MRVYSSNGNGCLVLAIIMALLIMIIGFFGKILFTTPLGIALIIALGVKYIIDQRKKSVVNESNSSFTQGQEHGEFSSESYTHDESSFDRSDYLDVEEVEDYREVDK